jgi:hypothetical protein
MAIHALYVYLLYNPIGPILINAVEDLRTVVQKYTIKTMPFRESDPSLDNASIDR